MLKHDIPVFFPINLFRTTSPLSARTGSTIVRPIFQVLFSYSVGFKSGQYNVCVISAVCFRSLSCLEVSLHPILRSWVLLNRISSITSLVFDLFIFLSNPTNFPVPTAEKHFHSIRLPPQCCNVGLELSRWQAAPNFLYKTCKTMHSGQSFQSWFCQTMESCFSFKCPFELQLSSHVPWLMSRCSNLKA